MQEGDRQIADYIRCFRNGDRDAAFFGLLEMGHQIDPALMGIFRNERDRIVRALLVEVIWQHRQASVIPFLGEAVQDAATEVWKQALDGLVSLASAESLAVMQSARDRRPSESRESSEYCRRVDEAIEQAESAIQST